MTLKVIHDLSRLPVVTFFKRSEAEIPMPYNNAKCRKSVYQLLLTILTTSTSQRLSPDQVIRRGFSIGLNDHSNEVNKQTHLKAVYIYYSLKDRFQCNLNRIYLKIGTRHSANCY
jgi:hypothetical protein